jgi:hypothetical protein
MMRIVHLVPRSACLLVDIADTLHFSCAGRASGRSACAAAALRAHMTAAAHAMRVRGLFFEGHARAHYILVILCESCLPSPSSLQGEMALRMPATLARAALGAGRAAAAARLTAAAATASAAAVRAVSTAGDMPEIGLMRQHEPFGIAKSRSPKVATSAEEAVACIESGSRVFIQTAAMTPTPLVVAMAHEAKRKGLKGVEVCPNRRKWRFFRFEMAPVVLCPREGEGRICPTPNLCARAALLPRLQTAHLHLEGAVPHLSAEFAPHFRDKSFFTGANAREAVNAGRSEFVPIFLSEIPLLFRRGIQPVDVALISVSPVDKHGYRRCVIVACLRCATGRPPPWHG